MHLVFVSHATVDWPLVHEFVDEILIGGIGITQDEIFCSSMPDMDVRAGADLMASIREEVGAATVVIAIVSPMYQTRPACVAELGAAWGLSGKLLPVLVPGLPRADLQGVLGGLKATYLNEESTLDEVARQLVDASDGIQLSPGTWSRRKRKFLGRLDELVAGLERPDFANPEELAAIRQQVVELSAAVDELESELEAASETIEALKKVKDAVGVAEVMLPVDDIDRFWSLQKAASASLSSVSRAVREAVRHRVAGTEFFQPDFYTDALMAEAVDESLTSGHLLGGDGEPLSLSTKFRPVREAVEAVEALHQELDEGFDPEFYDWFEGEFGGPAELGAKAVWDAVFPRLG